MQLVYKGEAALYQIAAEVPQNEDVSELLDFMWETMFKNNGMGLASNQVNVLKRVIIMNTQKHGQVELINPKIDVIRSGVVRGQESCLSNPGKVSYRTRAKAIIITGYNRNWGSVNLKLKGTDVRCAQHEVDHLNGKVCWDE